jgi:hypothetical protein
MRSMIAALASFVLASCVVHEPAMGRFSSQGGMLGTWNAEATYCASTIESSPVGRSAVVWFAHKTGRVTTFELSIGEVEGTLNTVAVARVEPSRRVVLRLDHCRRLEVRQHPGVDGALGADVELDCEPAEGGRVTASLHAANCP